MANTELSSRFISAYNQIDQALRSQTDVKKSLSYTEAVHRAARSNSFVKKYEDDLVDYGRLRNAIVHSSNDDYVIAEPHIEVVEEYEKIARIICTPPLAVDTECCQKDVKTISASVSLGDTMQYLYKSGYSNVPVYKDGMLVGVANPKSIVKYLGQKYYEKQNINEVLQNTAIEKVVMDINNDNYYTVASSVITLDKVMNLFAENRKLVLVLITKTGSLLEPPMGLVTTGDIMNINKVLDDYD